MADLNHSSKSFLDLTDKLDAKLAHLSSMLYMTYGGGFESFNQWSDEIRDNYMWACSELSNECRQLSAELNRKHI